MSECSSAFRKCWPAHIKNPGFRAGVCVTQGSRKPWVLSAAPHQVWPDKPVVPALEKWSRESTYNGREFQDKLDPMRPHLEWGREPEQPLVILVSTGTCPHKKFQTVTKNEGRKTTCPLSCPFCPPLPLSTLSCDKISFLIGPLVLQSLRWPISATVKHCFVYNETK